MVGGEMKSKHSTATATATIRAAGQRSLPRIFDSAAAPSFLRSKVDQTPPVSLSDFLNRKLHRTSVLPFPLQGKPEQLCHSSTGECPGGENASGRTRLHEEKSCTIDESVFKLFNYDCIRQENADSSGLCNSNKVNVTGTVSRQRERKRKSPSGDITGQLASSGRDNRKRTQNHLVVVGDDPKPTQSANREGGHGKAISRSLYNHYENGSGWWDWEREGLDNDEVGCAEVWEGKTSTTLGGLEWH